MNPEQPVPCVVCEAPTSVQTGGLATRRGMLCPRCIEARTTADPRLVFAAHRRRRHRPGCGSGDPRVARPE
jgi:hypothetical protein